MIIVISIRIEISYRNLTCCNRGLPRYRTNPTICNSRISTWHPFNKDDI